MNNVNSALVSTHRQPLQRFYLVAAVGILFISAIALVAAIEPRYEDLSTIVPRVNIQEYRGQPTAEMSAALDAIGWSVTTWAAYFTVFETLLGAIGICIGLFLIWKKPQHWFVVFMGVGLATAFTGPVHTLYALRDAHAAWDIPVRLLSIIGYIGFAGSSVLFPNGRFVPAWTRHLSPIWIAYVTVTTLFAPEWGLPRLIEVIDTPREIVVSLITALWMGVGITSQFYRYFRRSTQLERQQTKWIVFGLIWFLLFSVPLLAIPIASSQPLISPPETPAVLTVQIAYLSLFYGNAIFMLIAIAFAILRYRLWEIDIIINRTLVYGILTALVLGIYVAVVGGLGAMFNATDNPIFSLIATGIIALSVQGLRQQIQRGVNRLMFGQRDEPLRVLERLGHQLKSAVSPEDMLDNAAQTVATALKVPYVAIYIRRAQEEVLQAEYGTPRTPTTDFPLIYQNERVGRLVIGQRSPGESLSLADQNVLDNITGQMSAAVHSVRLLAELQRSRERLVTAREEERRRLRRDLHDGLGPALASQTLKIDAALESLTADPDEARDLLTDVKAQSKTMVADVRRLVYELRPPALDEIGLVGALSGALAQMRAAEKGLSITLEIPDPLPELPAAVEVAAYRITMEAVTNVIKHAEARNCAISIRLEEPPSALALIVEDDGKGLPTPITAGVGLHSMRERAEELGGSFALSAAARGGSRIEVILPLAKG